MSTKARRTMALLRAATRAWPLAAARLYDIRPPNRQLTISRGPFFLARDRQEWSLRGSLHVTWLPSPTLRFHGTITRGSGMPEHGDGWTLRIPGARPATAAVTGVTWRVRGQVSGEIQGALHLGPLRPVRAIRLHVPNFHSCVGAPTRSKVGGGGYRRLTFQHDEWTIELDQTPDADKIAESLRIHGGFGVAHVGVVTRMSGSRFTASEAEDILTCLRFFLSFARGFWCAPIIIEGLRNRESLVWTRWLSAPRITDWREVSSWFPVKGATPAATAFTGFRDLWCQVSWRNQLRQVVHWYIAANMNTAAIEGSLVLAHAALERLAWTHLVVAGNHQPDAFDRKKTSTQRIEALLSSLSIASTLPSTGMADLATWAKTQGINTGPWAISEVRNMLVHPKRQATLMQASPTVRIEAAHLALWYIEVTLLALCRYNGSYLNRLHPGPTVFDATSRVPWMPDPPSG